MNFIRQAISLFTAPGLLKPRFRLKRVTELSNEHLEGISTLIFDKDDTLTQHGSYEPPPDIHQKLVELARNYRCVVVSNDPNLDPKRRVGPLRILMTEAPKPNNFFEIRDILLQQDSSLRTRSIVIIGDRPLTEIYMANKNGCRSILV